MNDRTEPLHAVDPAVSEAPVVSVIIPVWNDAPRLRLCLEAVLKQSLPRDRYEVIVVDNGSTDSSRAVAAEFSGVTVLGEPVPGSYNARNRGLAAARGDYVAFTDSDCIPDREWLENGLGAIRTDHSIGVVAGRIELFGTEAAQSRACADYEQIFIRPAAERSTRILRDCKLDQPACSARRRGRIRWKTPVGW